MCGTVSAKIPIKNSCNERPSRLSSVGTNENQESMPISGSKENTNMNRRATHFGGKVDSTQLVCRRACQKQKYRQSAHRGGAKIAVLIPANNTIDCSVSR